jgi:hypothetical protein
MHPILGRCSSVEYRPMDMRPPRALQDRRLGPLGASTYFWDRTLTCISQRPSTASADRTARVAKRPSTPLRTGEIRSTKPDATLRSSGASSLRSTRANPNPESSKSQTNGPQQGPRFVQREAEGSQALQPAGPKPSGPEAKTICAASSRRSVYLSPPSWKLPRKWQNSKHETRNPKQVRNPNDPMSETPASPPFSSFQGGALRLRSLRLRSLRRGSSRPCSLRPRSGQARQARQAGQATTVGEECRLPARVSVDRVRHPLGGSRNAT